MNNKDLARASGTGLSQAEPQEGLGPSGFDPSRVAHCSFADIGTAGPDTPPEFLAALDNYLSAFAKPEGEGQPCLKCGRPLCGGIKSFLMGEGGGFTWGIVHGEGRCSHCGWPARALHRVMDGENPESLVTIRNLVLQYHPDYVEVRRDSDGSGEAVETALAGSTEGDSAVAKPIAQPPSASPTQPESE